MNAFVNHFMFEFRTGIRNKSLLFLNYLFPLVFYLMMGLIMVGINPQFLETMIPAMAVFAVMAAMLLGIPAPLVDAREDGIFRSYKINGIPSSSILAIPALTTILHLLIVVAVITVSAPILFDAPLPVNWFNYLLIVLALTVAFSGISVLIGVISSSTNMQLMISQLIFIPSMLLGGMMVPYSMLPEAAGKVARLLPATHAMNAFNGLAMGGTADFNPWFSIAALAISGVLGFGLAVYLFNWDRHNATQRGHPLMAMLAALPYVVSILLY
jgi:ABC-2 type transport system permease protein